MARLIDAEFIEKWINREEHNTPDERWRPESEFAAMVDNAPTVDAVEVVRCKDCQSKEKIPYYPDEQFLRCTLHEVVMDSNAYCSHGVKMDGGDKA